MVLDRIIQISSSYISISVNRSAAAASGPRSRAPRSTATVAAPPRPPPLLGPGARPPGPRRPLPPPPPPRLSGPLLRSRQGSPRRGMQKEPRAGSAQGSSSEQAAEALEAAVQPSEDRARRIASASRSPGLKNRHFSRSPRPPCSPDRKSVV